MLCNAVDAIEVAVGNSVIARWVVLVKELVSGGDEAAFGRCDKRPHRRPRRRRVGHHTVLYALEHAIGDDLQRQTD